MNVHRGRPQRYEGASERLLREVPSFILDSYPVSQWGLSEGMALIAGHWRDRIAGGHMTALEMRASIVPVATLTSAMLEALLRGTSIDLREAEFQLIADESNRVITGRPSAVILQSGIT